MGHSSAGQRQPGSAPAFRLLSARKHATVRPVRRRRWGFKSRLLTPSRSAPIGVNCIPFEMGEVCFALQRDLQPPPPDLPPSFLPFCCICGLPEPNSCRSGRSGGLFFSFRLPMRCRVCWVLLQSVGLEGGRVARLQCLAELQSNHRGSVCFCAAAVLCVGVS